MPMGKWPDFEACVTDMQNSGHDADSAKRICGSIKAKVEGHTQEVKLTESESKVVEEALTSKFSDLEAEIFAVGTWNKDKYNQKDLQQMVDNFNSLKETVKPPAKIGHSEDQVLLKQEGLPAAGWVDSLKMVGNKVIATFKDVPKVVRDLIDKKAYRRVSAEIYPKYKDPVSGNTFNNVLRAVAFLGADTPAVETLSDIAALYSDSNPNGVKVYTIDVNDLNKQVKGGDIGMSKYRVSIEGLSQDELTKKFAEVFGADVKVNVEDQSVLDAEAQKKADEDAAAQAKAAEDKGIKEKKIEELTQQYEAVSKLQGDKDAEIAALKAKIAELEGMMNGGKEEYAKKLSEKDSEITTLSTEIAKFKQDAKSAAIKTFVKQSISEGKVLPKDEASIVALMEQLDDTAVVKFTQDGKESTEPMLDVLKKFVSGLSAQVVLNKDIAPQVEHKTFEGQVTINGNIYEVKNLELVAEAEKYSTDNKVSFDQAVIEISKKKAV